MKTPLTRRTVAGLLVLEIPGLGFAALLTAGAADTRLLMDGHTEGMSPLGYWTAGAVWLVLSAALAMCTHTLWAGRSLSLLRQASLVIIILAHLGFAGIMFITPGAVVSPVGIAMMLASLGLAGFLGNVLYQSRVGNSRTA